MKRCSLVSLSGGIDSTVTLAHAMKQGGEVIGVRFMYPSKHNYFECKASEQIAEFYGVKLLTVDLTTVFHQALFKSNLLRGQGEIPEGHYEDKSMSQTVVPCRNMIFISVLAGIAKSQGCMYAYLGVHSGDHAIYPDCRPDFIEDMSKAVAGATENDVILQAPFLFRSKEEIVRKGNEFMVPFHLTRTCYKNQRIACGKCGSCIERLEAFGKNGIVDPIEYEQT